MAKRLPWGHKSRHCARCGEVGPRVHNPTGPGWIHAYCRTDEEKRAERRDLAAQKRKAAESGYKPPMTNGPEWFDWLRKTPWASEVYRHIASKYVTDCEANDLIRLLAPQIAHGVSLPNQQDNFKEENRE